MGTALTAFNAQLSFKGVFLASPNKIAMEDTVAYVNKCKFLTYSSFVEDSQHSAIGKSTNADIVAFESEGDRVERRRQAQVARQGEGEGGGQEEVRVDTFSSADTIVADATNLGTAGRGGKSRTGSFGSSCEGANGGGSVLEVVTKAGAAIDAAAVSAVSAVSAASAAATATVKFTDKGKDKATELAVAKEGLKEEAKEGALEKKGGAAALKRLAEEILAVEGGTGKRLEEVVRESEETAAFELGRCRAIIEMYWRRREGARGGREGPKKVAREEQEDNLAACLKGNKKRWGWRAGLDGHIFCCLL